MHVVVCLKQVFSTTQVRVNPETHTVIREGGEWIINPFDEHALEAALVLKGTAGAKVTVLTAGPTQAEAALREALARGADAAMLLSDPTFEDSDAWATARILAAAIRKLGDVDLIICGKQTMDGDTALVGPALAEFLNWPCVTFVRKLALEGTTLKLERLFEDGFEKVEVALPAVLTVGKEINTPRMASLKGRMAAKKAVLTPVTAAALGLAPESIGLAGSPTHIVRMATPPRKTGGIKLDGSDAAATAQTVVAKLRELKLV